MKVLLDTQIVLWWLADDPKLGEPLRSMIVSGDNEVFVSAVSVAEIAIKKSIGKLRAPRELLALLRENGLRELAYSAQHADALNELPRHHGDPFDRMLVTQSKVEGIPLASADSVLSAYDVEVITP